MERGHKAIQNTFGFRSVLSGSYNTLSQGRPCHVYAYGWADGFLCKASDLLKTRLLAAEKPDGVTATLDHR